MYYVSYVREFPVYEPAEGGYYYAGERIESCRQFKTWRKARQFYNKVRRDFWDEYGGENEYIEHRIWEHFCGGCNKWGEGPRMEYNAKYIGDGAWIGITTYKPEEHGYEPYC